MQPFLGLLWKELTIRRKSCCPIFAHLVGPLVLILLSYVMLWWLKEFILSPAYSQRKENPKAPNVSLPSNILHGMPLTFRPILRDERRCVDESTEWPIPPQDKWKNKAILNPWLEGPWIYTDDKDTELNNLLKPPKQSSFSNCSFGNSCTLGMDTVASVVLQMNISDVDILTQAARIKSLINTCLAYKDVDTNVYWQKCDSNGNLNERRVSFDPFIGVSVSRNVDNAEEMTLEYFAGEPETESEEGRLVDNILKVHFTLLSRIYWADEDDDENSPSTFMVYIERDRIRFFDMDAKRQKIVKALFGKNTGYKTVSIISMLSLTVPVYNILFEKRFKLKELMHMSGVGNFKYYLAYFTIDFPIVFIINIVALIINTPASPVHYLVTGFYSIAVTLFALGFTVFFQRELIGSLIFACFLIFDTVVLELLFHDPGYIKETPDWIKLIFGLYPAFGIRIAFESLDTFKTKIDTDKYGLEVFTSVPFKSLFRTHEENPTFLQPPYTLIVIIASWFLWLTVIFYVGAIWPWQSATPKPLLFPLASLSKRFKSSTLEKDKNEASPHFEPVTSSLKVGIEVNNIKKTFGLSKTVVKGVFLKVYYGQITVLLGHNGAGKTTLMSIITGLESATSGKVIIDGIDTDYDPTKARSHIGMCPQSNSLYNSLTVGQHFYLFGMLKRFPRNRLNQEILRVADLVRLTDKTKTKSKSLSGGMKRRLQLGMAFIGGSRILILDEPSSGLDIEARRVVWDLLLAVKDDYLIFLTTHHMEEADCLGDRIAIMHDGEICCAGTSMFLKRVFGGDLILRVSKTDGFKQEQCSEFITQHLQSATFSKESRTEALYHFSKAEVPKLPQFFNALEAVKGQLCISSCGVSISTLDDVFIRVGQVFEKKSDVHEPSELSIQYGMKPSKPTFSSCFYGLLVKRLYSTKRSTLFYSLFAISIVFALCFSMARLKSLQTVETGFDSDFNAKIDISCSPAKDPLCDAFSDDKKTEHPGLNITVQTGKDGQRPCILLKLKEGSELAALTKAFEHLLRYKNATIKSIKAGMEPAEKRVKGFVDMFAQVRRGPTMIVLWALVIIIPSYRAVHSEKKTNVKLLQLMTGLSPFTYWLAHFVYDIILALVIALPVFILMPVMYLVVGGRILFNSWSCIVIFYVVFLYFILSCVCYSYGATFLPFEVSAGMQSLIYFCLLSSTIGVPVGESFVGLARAVDKNESLSPAGVPLLIVYWLFCLSPHSQLSLVLVMIFEYSMKRSFCEDAEAVFGKATICANEKLRHICCSEDNLEIVRNFYEPKKIEQCVGVPLLMGSVALLAILVSIYLTEILKVSYRKRTQKATQPIGEEDEDVFKERQATEKILMENEQSEKALVLHDLSKQFGHKYVVNRLTVTVEQNQIFGFLGVNGAGKTTAFKMMVGEISRTAGEVYIGRYSLSKDFHQYRAQIGYCPQFDCFVEGLTAREMITLFARLRGINSSELEKAVQEMIQLVDLQDHASRVADNYSGGNKRKLSVGMALMAFPKVIFLDEPTAAVDPVARRKIWKVMEYAQKATGSSIVLTSHALDECEALCEKIVVMVAGQLKCLGSLQHLKEKFGQGLNITSKTKPGSVNIEQVQKAIMTVVPSAKVVDSHTNVTMLHINDPKVKIGDVYGYMEEIRKQFDLEDYQVEETNLEQIFLYFAKEAYGKNK